MERSSCWNCICWKNWGAASILRDVGKDSVLNSHQFYNWRICNLCISGEVWPIETSIREDLTDQSCPPSEGRLCLEKGVSSGTSESVVHRIPEFGSWYGHKLSMLVFKTLRDYLGIFPTRGEFFHIFEALPCGEFLTSWCPRS